MKTKSRDKIINILKWLWFIACAVILVVYLHCNLDNLLNSDMSSDLVHAQHLAEEGKWILSKDWYYSTEIKFIENQLVFAPLFLIFKSWQTVRIVGTLISMALMLGALYILLKEIKLEKSFLWIAGCLLLPITKEYFYVMQVGAFYIFTVLFSLLLVGFLLGMNKPQSKKTLLIKGLLLLLIGFCAGTYGLRLILTVAIPLIACVAVKFVMDIYSLELSDGQGLIANLKDNSKYYISAALALTGMLAGLVFNFLYLEKNYSFRTYSGLCWEDTPFIRLPDVIKSILQLLGYEGLMELTRKATLVNIFAIFLFAFIAYVIIDLLFINRKKLDENRLELVRLTAYGMLALVGVFFFTPMTIDPTYYLSVLILAFPIVAVYFDTKKEKGYFCNLLKAILFCGIIVCSAINLISFKGEFGKEDFLCWTNPQRREIAEFLADNEYYNGYATFWNANVLTEYTDGKVEVWALDSYKTDLCPWLQKKEHFDKNPEGKVFLLMEELEISAQGMSDFIQDNRDKLIYDDGQFYIIDIVDFDPEYLHSHFPWLN